jgi:trans-aconitate 2-methyltransferase
VFRNFAQVLRPSGQLAAQAGAPGNVTNVLEALAAAGEDYRPRYHFADPDRTRQRLQAAGFTDIDIWTHDEPTTLPGRRELEDYLRTIFLGPLSARSADELPGIAAEAAERMGTLTLDYVRLNIRARRGESAP